MKNSITLLIALFISISGFTQPENINYKAVIKDGNGNVLVSQTLDVKFTILKNTGNSIVYEETHSNETTDANGVLIVNIGDGTTTGSIGNVDWGSDIHSLKTEIDIEQDGSFVNLGQTGFNAVPYALYAPDLSTGLERITENDGMNDNTGWRLVGSDPNVFGPIGFNAIDLNTTGAQTNDFGATAWYSIAMGSAVRASGDNSISIGTNTHSESYRATAMGSNNIGGGTNNSWFPEDPLFEIGNSDDENNKSNALTVLKNGTITAPSFDLSEITNDKALITKEFADANYNNIPFSGDYNDLTNQPTIILPTGLERVTDINTGWRLNGQNAFFHANIGVNAVDLSIVDGSTTGIGASGFNSFSTGSNTKASSDSSTAMGNTTSAIGLNATAMGNTTSAIGSNATAMGQHTIATANSSTAMGKFNDSETDGLFMVGNGTSTNNRNNALLIRENGNAQFDGEIQRTSTGSANMVPIAYGTVESNGNILSGTGNFTAEVTAGVFTISVNGEPLTPNNSSCSIVPYSTASRNSSIIHLGNDLIVRIFNSSGTLTATTFQFVIYKL